MKRSALFLFLYVLACSQLASGQTPVKVSGVVTLSATATDPSNPANPNEVVCGLDYAQFYLDGQALGPTLTVEPYTYKWDSTTKPNGVYSLIALALDKAGPGTACDSTQPNTGQSPELRIEVANPLPDRTPPIITITTPVADTILNPGKADIDVAASDPSGIQRMELWIVSTTSQSFRASTEPGATTLHYLWNTNPFKGQWITLLARAKDMAGNEAEARTAVSVRR